MNIDTVYQLAKALPKEDQFLLFEKLRNDFFKVKKKKNNRKETFTKEIAIDYLLTHIFIKKAKENVNQVRINVNYM